MEVDWKPGNPVVSYHECNVEEGGVPTLCAVGSDNSKEGAVSAANTKAFEFTQSVIIGVRQSTFCSKEVRTLEHRIASRLITSVQATAVKHDYCIRPKHSRDLDLDLLKAWMS